MIYANISIRTPGMFLDRESADFAGTLTFQFERNGNWVSPSDMNITVVERGTEGEEVTSKLATSSLDVPTRDVNIKKYTLLVPNPGNYRFRVVATDCPDCETLFGESESLRPRVLGDGSVVVAEGILDLTNVVNSEDQ